MLVLLHMNMKLFYAFLPSALIITLLSGTIYMTAQQVFRLTANDPQIQIAEDIGAGLENGQPVPTTPPTTFVEADHSLATFVSIFNEDGTAAYSNAKLNNNSPIPPAGTFGFARTNGEDRFTWQPASGQRFATVLRHYGGAHPGFVMVARSLRESEARDRKFMMNILIAWAVTMVTAFGATWLKLKKV